MALNELDHLMSSPEAMAAAIDAHKIDMAFYLWSVDADGGGSREKVICALTWLLQEEHKPGEASGRGPEVIKFLEREKHSGLSSLDRDAFRAVVQRFRELIGLPVPVPVPVCEFLRKIALGTLDWEVMSNGDGG
ncbi:g8653 [Coccomyxa elongata]